MTECNITEYIVTQHYTCKTQTSQHRANKMSGLRWPGRDLFYVTNETDWVLISWTSITTVNPTNRRGPRDKVCKSIVSVQIINFVFYVVMSPDEFWDRLPAVSQSPRSICRLHANYHETETTERSQLSNKSLKHPLDCKWRLPWSSSQRSEFVNDSIFFAENL